MEGGKQTDGKLSDNNGKDSTHDQQNGTKTVIDEFRKDGKKILII